jgi:nicotinamidase-related amidase
MIQDPERKNKLIESAKTLLTTARKHNVTIAHCVINTKTDPPPTNKVLEQWATIHKPALSTLPELAAEYPELAPNPDGAAPGGGHESISLRAPGYRSVLVAKGLLPLLQELQVKHLILGGLATNGAVLGMASHATDLDFVVTVVEDACWDPDEKVHRVLVNTVIRH